MATVFKNVLASAVGTGTTPQLVTGSNVKTTVIGLSLSNVTDSIVLASVFIEDTIENTSAYFIKNIIVPPDQSLRVINGGERLVLGPSTNLLITSNTADSLDLVLSYVEIN